MKEIKDEQESSAQSSTESKDCCDYHRGHRDPCNVCGDENACAWAFVDGGVYCWEHRSYASGGDDE